MNSSKLLKPWMTLSGAAGELDILDVVDDSRLARPGSLFIATKGHLADGHDYIGKAIENGAVMVLAERSVEIDTQVPIIVLKNLRQLVSHIAARFFGDPSKKLKMVAVTGTNGKSSFTYLFEAIMTVLGHTVGIIGTVAYRWPGTELPAPTTTPGPVEFQRILARMLADGVDVVVCEVSSHALDQGRARGVAFDVGAFTNLALDHLDYHHDQEDYFRAKQVLFTHVLPEGGKPAAAVTNLDDPRGESMVEGFEGPVYRVATLPRQGAELVIEPGDCNLREVTGILHFAGQSARLALSLVGRFHLSNSSQAIAAALALGENFQDAVQAVSTCTNIPGRMERVPHESIHVFVDYSHTADSLEKALEELRAQAGTSRVISVMGCGGDRDASKRAPMGRTAAKLADLVMVTSDNPRTEDPFEILEQVEAGVQEENLPRFETLSEGCEAEKGYAVIEDREQAILEAVAWTKPGDAVLISGKGHEDYQIVGREKRHFDDREVAAKALEIRERNA